MRRAGLWGTRAVLALSTATMPLPARLCGARQALTQTSRGKDRPDSQRSRSKPLHCSSSGSFLLKDKCSVWTRQIYIYFLFLPGLRQPRQVKGQDSKPLRWSLEKPGISLCHKCGRKRQAASTLGSLGKWSISQDGKGPPPLW